MKFYLIISFLTLLLCSCSSEPTEEDKYQIITEILNYTYGHDTDDENGLGWVDLSQSYTSLKVINHTNLREIDIEIIKDYLEFNNISDYSIEDFTVYWDLDINKITNYERYRLETEKEQKDSNQIGVIQFSSISFKKDFKEAIVYTSFYCGGECGEGQVFHLEKKDKWKIKKAETLWVS
jgi:hypothetical protein